VQVTPLRRTLVSFFPNLNALVAFSALLLLVGRQEGHLSVKNGGRWRWALVSPDGVAPSRIVEVLFRHRLTRVVPEKGRKNGCVCVFFSWLMTVCPKHVLMSVYIIALFVLADCVFHQPLPFSSCQYGSICISWHSQ